MSAGAPTANLTSPVKEILIVGLGGFAGSIARYKIGGWILRSSADWRFPLSTFLVNVAGCLAIGLLAGLAERQDFFSPAWRILLFAGLLGGFTTFSAFGFETVYLLRRGEWLIAGGYVCGSVLVGLAAVWIGLKCGSFGSHGG